MDIRSVPYDTYRSEIQSGDLLVWSTGGVRTFRDFQLKLVQLLTNSMYDHVGIAWAVGNRVLVIEATPPAVRIYPVSKLLPFYHIKMNVPWTRDMESYLLTTVGEPYSIMQAIISFFRNPPRDREWQCAELVNAFYKESVGLEVADSFTPKEVVNIALAYSKSPLVLVT